MIKPVFRGLEDRDAMVLVAAAEKGGSRLPRAVDDIVRQPKSQGDLKKGGKPRCLSTRQHDMLQARRTGG
jgi:hypothetical protein